MPYLVIGLVGGVLGLLSMRACDNITAKVPPEAPPYVRDYIVPMGISGTVALIVYVLIKKGGLK